jgi:hypothetical protein
MIGMIGIGYVVFVFLISVDGHTLNCSHTVTHIRTVEDRI